MKKIMDWVISLMANISIDAMKTLELQNMQEKMSYVRNYMSEQGVMPVGWKTAFSYYILDYGKVGTIVFCFLW